MLPLLERKRRLRGIVPVAPSSLLCVDHVVGTGTAVDLFGAVLQIWTALSPARS